MKTKLGNKNAIKQATFYFNKATSFPSSKRDSITYDSLKSADLAQKLEISEVKGKSNIYFFAGIITLMLSFIGFLILYDTQKRKKNNIELKLKKEHKFTKHRIHLLENISHEIRTPLALIIGYLNLIKQARNKEQIEEHTKCALSNSMRAIHNTNKILDLLKVEKENSGEHYKEFFPKLLIVGDGKEMTHYLDEILTPHFNCNITYNGKDALDKVKQKEYDLIVSDLRMPEMDGFEFKVELNKVKRYKSIPFLMISANTFIETKIERSTLGINNYITKPFSKKELIARIQNLLNNKIVQNETIKMFDENNIRIDYGQSMNAKFLKKIIQIVRDNLGDDKYKVSELALACNYSQRQLSRILLKITGMSPVIFILEIRLLKAYELIINKTYPNIGEIMFSVGITSNSYFNKKFYERFGVKAGELLKK